MRCLSMHVIAPEAGGTAAFYEAAGIAYIIGGLIQAP